MLNKIYTFILQILDAVPCSVYKQADNSATEYYKKYITKMDEFERFWWYVETRNPELVSEYSDMLIQESREKRNA